MCSSDLLGKFGVQGLAEGHWCDELDEEGLNHTFCSGRVAKAVWSCFEEPGDRGVFTLRHRVLWWWLRPGRNVYLKFVDRRLPMLVCWELWKARNRGVFEGKRVGGDEVVRQVFHHLRDLFHCHFPEIPG